MPVRTTNTTRKALIPVKQEELVIIATSYSRAKNHKLCPAQCGYKNVKQLRDKYGIEPQNDAMFWGSAVHLMGQAFIEAKAPIPEGRDTRDAEMWAKFGAQIKAAANTLPPVFKAFAPEMQHMRKVKARAEVQWAFFTGADGNTAWARADWFDKYVHRIKVDVVWYDKATRTVHIPDFKTGKHNPDEHLEQLDTYAIAAFLMYPDALHCHASLFYLEHGIDESADYEVSELPALKKWYEGLCKPMLADRKFRPKPNSRCRWCHYRKSNGGPCKEGGA